MPAIVDRSPVIVAVGTGGASATLAKALRERLEALLPAALGAARRSRLIGAAKTSREVRGARASAGASGIGCLAPGGRLDPLAADHDAAQAIDAAIDDPEDPGNVDVEITVSSADPDDLTLRQLRLLSRADVIVHDARLPRSILDRARRDAVG